MQQSHSKFKNHHSKLNMRKYAILIGVIALVAMAFTPVSIHNEPTAKEIVAKSDKVFRGSSNKAVMNMTIVRPNWKRTMTMKSWSLGDDYGLTLVTAPARDKGTAFLKREREMWNWQPRIDRVIKMPPSMMTQSWMGSDLKNEDLVRQASIIEDYQHTIIGNEKVSGRDCYKIELVPKEDVPVVWGKVVMSIDKKDYLQLKTRFYDEDGEIVNIIVGTSIKKMKGRTIPTKMVVVPADNPKNRTILEYKSIEFDIPMKKEFFSIQNMKRAR